MVEVLTSLWTAVRDGRADAVLVVAKVDGKTRSFGVGDDRSRTEALSYLVCRELQEKDG
jgi:hypothetical protein